YPNSPDNYVVGTNNTTTVNIIDHIPGLAVNINETIQTNSIETYGDASVLNGKSLPQDTPQAIVTYNDNGNEVQIENNGWKQFALGNYNITKNSILNFEFRSTSQAEIQGIGFDKNDNVFDNTNTLFQLYGTQ
ncbi:hypothetical protein VB691_09490, partial [Crocosphaera sp. XPORK-15E]|nr:hypothetical protein [Crocosphaera sp. XPORK-15E]